MSADTDDGQILFGLFFVAALEGEGKEVLEALEEVAVDRQVVEHLSRADD